MVAIISICVALILSVTLNLLQELQLEKKDKELKELRNEFQDLCDSAPCPGE